MLVFFKHSILIPSLRRGDLLLKGALRSDYREHVEKTSTGTIFLNDGLEYYEDAFVSDVRMTAKQAGSGSNATPVYATSISFVAPPRANDTASRRTRHKTLVIAGVANAGGEDIT